MDSIEQVRIFEQEEDGVLQAQGKSCEICLDKSGRYTCPRCNISYCSVNCFKHSKHSGCSESFYKDCFIQEMQRSKADDNEKKRIMQMLKEFEDQDIEDAEYVSLEERLQNINLDNSDEVWKRLTPDEQAEFSKRMQNGSLVTSWKPWWHQHDTSLVSEIEDHVKDSKSLRKSQVPQSNLEVPLLSTLLRGKEPSILIRNNIIDVLYSYAYFCIIYNGNTQDFSFEIPHDIISSSPFLNDGKTAQTCGEAISGAINGCIKCEGVSHNQISLETVLDVYHILLGPDKDCPCAYTIAALSELHGLCRQLRKLLRKQQPVSELSSEIVFRAMKKLEFLIAWVNENHVELLQLSLEVISYYKDRKSFESEHEQCKGKLKRLREDHLKQVEPAVLIQEIG